MFLKLCLVLFSSLFTIKSLAYDCSFVKKYSCIDDGSTCNKKFDNECSERKECSSGKGRKCFRADWCREVCVDIKCIINKTSTCSDVFNSMADCNKKKICTNKESCQQCCEGNFLSSVPLHCAFRREALNNCKEYCKEMT